MNEKYIQALRDVIQKTHRCVPRYAQSVAVKEEANGQTVWEGNVEVFDLGGHPQARQCYGWSYKDGDGHLQYVTVLKAGAVDSPRRAVQSYMATRTKPA